MSKDQYTLEQQKESIELDELWQRVQKRLSEEVERKSFERFLRPLKVVKREGSVIHVGAPGRFVNEWVRERYVGKLQGCISDELGERVTIELISTSNEREPVASTPSRMAVVSTQAVVEAPTQFKPHERFTFETFVVGQSNRLAFAGANAVASQPGAKYNPLFIYGMSGLGKTHLLHAIAREVLERDPKFPLVYVTAQQFAEEFVTALQTNRIDQFRKAQRGVGLWLVDDIQFIAGKDKTQEEIFHTFNYLHSLGKQIVLSSDRPPRDLYLLDERLRSRFEAGLVADISLPDTETRCAILQSKADQDRIEIPHDVAMFLAENVPGNIRILEGALTKLAVQASIEGMSIELDLARELVDRHYHAGSLAKPGFDQIVDAVSKHYKIAADDIRGSSRKAPIAHARHVAVYITREVTRDSWKHIGGMFGDRDHTSMIHGYQKIREMMAQDKDVDAAVKTLIRNLYPNAG